MNKITISVISAAAAVALFFGGLAFGSVLRDDQSQADAASRLGVGDLDTSEIAVATPVPIDPSLPPGVFSDLTPDLDLDRRPPPSTAPPTTLTRVIPPAIGDPHPALSEADLVVLYDPETGIDAVSSRDPWVPPELPASDEDESPTSEDTDVDDESGELTTTTETDSSPPPGDTSPEPSDTDEPFLFDFPLSDLWLRFIDPCAGTTPDESDGEDCGDGIGGTIVLTDGDGEPPSPLSIFRQIYSLASFELRCGALRFAPDGSYGAVFSTNNPGRFTVNYRASRRPDSAQSIEVSTSPAEFDRWVDRRMNDERISSEARYGVHHCISLTGLFPGEHVTLDISGVDEFGSESSVTIYHTLPEGEASGTERSVGRPPSVFEMRSLDAGYGRVRVPYNGSEEKVYIASLPRAGARATTETCSDVENDVLTQRRRMDPSLYNWDTHAVPEGFGDDFDPRINAATTADFLGEEGTWHDICVWVTKPPVRTFDKPTVVMRNLHQVRPPRRWRARLSLVGGWGNVPLSAGDLQLSLNWPGRSSRYWPERDMGASTYVFREPFVIHDGGSSPVPATTLLTVTAPGGSSTEVSIPSFTGCIPVFSCSARTTYYDVEVPGGRPGSGPAATLRLAFELYAGPGGEPEGHPFGLDGWQISRDDTFRGGGPLELPETPQVDSNASSYTVVGGDAGVDGGRPRIVADLAFDRPVTVVAEPLPLAGGCHLPTEPQTTTEPSSRVRLTFENLCWGAMYTLKVEATDTDGNVLRDVSLATLPIGTRPWMVVDTPPLPVAEYQVRVTVSDTPHGVREATMYPWTIVERRSRACATDPIDESTTIRNSGGAPLHWDEPFRFNLELHLATRECGHHLSSSRRVTLTATPTLEELLGGPYTAQFVESDGTEVTIEISDVVFAEP